MVSYPQQVTHKHWEANWQGSRPQSSISPLIRHSEDHNHELQSQEYLYSGGHSQTDAWLKLKAYIHIHFTNNSEIVIKYIYCTLFYLCEIAFLQQVLWLCFDISMVSNIDQSFCITSKQAIVSTNELTKTNTPSYRVQAKIASHIARCDPIQHSGSSQSSQALSTDVEERTKQGQLGANQVGERDSLGWCGHRWCDRWTGWVWQLPDRSRRQLGARCVVRWSNAELIPARRTQRTWCHRTRQTQPAKKT